MVAAVERVAVGRDDLRLEGLVRPCEGHFSRCGPDEVVPLRHLLHLAGAQVFDEKDVCVALEAAGAASDAAEVLDAGAGGASALRPSTARASR